jgi:hypothetical protein
MAEHEAHESVKKLRRRLWLDRIHPLPRMILVGILGGLCLVAGIFMIFTPGPAVVFVPLGLLLLATEFPWADRLARRLREKLAAWRDRWRRHKGPPPTDQTGTSP